MKTYTAQNGVPFNYRLIVKGDNYGLNDCRTSTSNEPMIEFYDARYDHTKYGQFVSRYYITTMAQCMGEKRGVNLDGGVDDWEIDRDTLADLLDDAFRELRS